MRVKYIGDTDPFFVIQGRIYEVIQIKEEMYLIRDESGQHYHYPSELFEIINKGLKGPIQTQAVLKGKDNFVSRIDCY